MDHEQERAVNDLVLEFFEVENELDPAVLLDRRLAAAVVEGRGGLLNEALAAALQLPADHRHYAHWFDQTGVPDGPPGPWQARAKPYLAMVADRLQQIMTGDAVIPPEPDVVFDGQTWPRVGRFISDETARTAADVVLERHAEELELMRSGESVWSRLHLHDDVSDTLGTVGTVEVIDPPRHLGAQPTVANTVTTGNVSVIVERERPRGLHVVAVNPDVPLDTDVRTIFPALTQYFGGFFGPTRVALLSDPYRSSFRANLGTKPEGRRFVARELDTLLMSGDDDMEVLQVVEACGSYVLPRAVRHWLDRLRWRLDAYDWGEARGRWFS